MAADMMTTLKQVESIILLVVLLSCGLVVLTKNNNNIMMMFFTMDSIGLSSTMSPKQWQLLSFRNMATNNKNKVNIICIDSVTRHVV